MPDFSRALRQLQPDALREKPQGRLIEPINPMLSLSHQLQYLKERNPVAPEHFGGKPTVALPPGDEQNTPFGRHFIVRNVFDSEHWHGRVRLSRFSSDDLQQLLTTLQETAKAPDRDSIVFLDTETTGLQGGTGMVPFLVGVGFFEGSDFHMLQFFMRDFDEETSMLHALGLLLARFRLVVTYNGLSFDLPLLETRFTLARLENPLAAMPHFDLLAGARRLWRNGHGSCRLVALEREIVAFHRGKDVPGARIPRVYFDFVNGMDSPELAGVFIHNVYDVVSLAALTITACDRVIDEPAPFDNPLDLYSLARILDNSVNWKKSRTLYQMALAAGLPAAVHDKATESLSVIYRRCGDHENALAACVQLMQSQIFSLTAYEGAAIHYERIERNPARALEIVEAALSRLEELPEHKRRRLLLELRRERLRQKVISF